MESKRYIIQQKYLKNITPTQLEAMLSKFCISPAGDIVIDFEHKGYKCKEIVDFLDSDTQAISLFSGAGGLDIGAQIAGVKVISSLDTDKDSIETLKINPFFNHCQHRCADIASVTSKEYSEIIRRNNPHKLLIIGGPPCQPFSKAGYWVTNQVRDSTEDPRNLIKPYFRVIEEIQPDGFLIENVESILHPTNHEAVEAIYDNIARLNYYCSLLKINAADYGIPQKRKRVFFLASKKKIDAVLPPTHGSEKQRRINPALKSYARVIDWIGLFDLPEYCEQENLSTDGKWEYELKCIPFGRNYIALSAQSGHPNPKFVAGKRYWSSLLKLHPLEPSWTVIASPGHWEGPFHWKNRRLNLKELAAIQTFPDDYAFFGSARSKRRQIGNAVPPMLAQKIVSELCKWI
ncbi:DNA cytosine methyltransferase [Chloroflexota bacterium]